MDIKKNREQDELFMEVPSTPHYPYPDKIPSPSDPMGQIYTEGLVLRSLASGNVKWWVLISGWVFYGIVFLVFVSISLSLKSYLSSHRCGGPQPMDPCLSHLGREIAR